jgi:hypothetical protein
MLKTPEKYSVTTVQKIAIFAFLVIENNILRLKKEIYILQRYIYLIY